MRKHLFIKSFPLVALALSPLEASPGTNGRRIRSSPRSVAAKATSAIAIRHAAAANHASVGPDVRSRPCR